MLKTKYERMSKEEKKSLITKYKKTDKGKSMLNRLFRVTIIGILLNLYSIVYFIIKINNLKLIDYLIIIPISIVGLGFIIMAYNLKKQVLNKFAINGK